MAIRLQPREASWAILCDVPNCLNGKSIHQTELITRPVIQLDNATAQEVRKVAEALYGWFREKLIPRSDSRYITVLTRDVCPECAPPYRTMANIVNKKREKEIGL